MLGKMRDWCFTYPNKFASAMAVCSAPFAAYGALDGLAASDKLPTVMDALQLGLYATSPMMVFVGVSFGTYFLRAFTWDSKDRGHTRKGDYSRLNALEREVAGVIPPENRTTGSARVGYSAGELLREQLEWDRANDRWKNALKTKNPGLAHDAAMKFFDESKYDDALECLRCGFDWLQGKRPELSLVMRSGSWVPYVAARIQRRVEVRNVSNYILLAAQEALARPERSFYWSELGRRVAKEFASPRMREMFVFHALLASAQRRSDERDAWRDAIRLLMAGSQVESASERESRSEVFRFSGDFFSNTLIVKKRPDLASLVSECDWQRKGRDAASAYEVPEPLYVSDGGDDLSCFAMRYRKGEVMYDLLEKGDKSGVDAVARALGQIHAKVPLEGLARVELWKKARDKLYDGNLGVSRELANAILANYGAVERGAWLAPAVINKDAHPEQWIVGERLTAIDWEIDAAVPLMFDSANFTAYRDFFAHSERREFVGKHVAAYRAEGGDVQGENVLVSFYNSVIHRMICFAGAWSGPSRKRMRPYRKEAVLRAVGAIDSLESCAKKYYQENAGEYAVLRKSLVAMADLMLP